MVARIVAICVLQSVSVVDANEVIAMIELSFELIHTSSDSESLWSVV